MVSLFSYCANRVNSADAEFHTVAGKQLIYRFTVRNESIHRLLPPFYKKGASSLLGKSAFTFHEIFYHRRKILSTAAQG